MIHALEVGKIDEVMINASFGTLPSLVTMCMNIFAANTMFAALLRFMLASAELPLLKHFNLVLTVANLPNEILEVDEGLADVDADEGPAQAGYPFGMPPNPANASPILSEFVAEQLRSLHMEFTGEVSAVVLHDLEAFFRSFGAAARPGILRVNELLDSHIRVVHL
jgi:hypothetical protein